MNYQRISTFFLFLFFLGLSLVELAPKWKEAAHKESGSVLYVRSVKKTAPARSEKKTVSYDSILKANSKNKDG